jgi:hypothetical protein
MSTLRKLAIIAVSAIALIAVAIAQADTITATGGAGGGGTKAKPKANAPYFVFSVAGPRPGARPATPTKVIAIWTGERENAAGFPVCTAAMIQTKESDSGCPRGSLIGTGTLKAKVGPAGNPDSNATCSKQISIYNGGGNRAVQFYYGPGAACAGVSYLPPVPMYWSNAGGKATLTLPVPENVSHPLPGVEGTITAETLKFKKLISAGKKRHAYLAGIGCGSRRARSFTYTLYASSYPGGKLSKTVRAGKC